MQLFIYFKSLGPFNIYQLIIIENLICFELTIPDDIRNEGISEFKIRADYFKTFLLCYINWF